MNIKKIETKHVVEQPFKGLVVIEDFEPYYSCTILTDKGTFRGQGDTEYTAEQNALENAKASLASEVYTAIEKYNAAHGAGMLDIA